jgi:anti-sigma regulatory factor (Ser/Thr protein kinase)
VDVVLTNKPGDRQRLVEQLHAFAREVQLPKAALQAADLALEEHLTNVINYSYEDKQTHEILVRLEIEGGALLVEVFDDGRPFDPLQRPEVDTTVPLDEKPIGGLGVHLMRKFMDELDYRREDGKNVFRMRKKLGTT